MTKTKQKRLSELAAKVSAINPSARVETCSYGRVPLHAVLDVEAPRTDIQGVSHEVKVYFGIIVSRVRWYQRESSEGKSGGGIQ